MKITHTIILTFAVALICLSTACSAVRNQSEVRAEEMDEPAMFADVHVEILPDGTLHATSIELNDEESGDRDSDELEFEAQVVSISEDGLSFTVLGNLVVMYLDEEEYDDEAEDDLYYEIEDLKIGDWVEAEGFYSEKENVFYAVELNPHDDLESSIEAEITREYGNTITMLGLVIIVDDRTQMITDDDEDEYENEGDDDGDEGYDDDDDNDDGDEGYDDDDDDDDNHHGRHDENDDD